MDASGDLRAQRFLRITALAVGSLAFWRLLFWIPERDLPPLSAWLFLASDPFPQAIFLIAAALVYRRRASLRSAMRDRGSPALAAVPLLAGSSLFAWGHFADAMDLVLVSFMLLSLGVGLLWHGVRFARALAIPLIVLAFAFPAPGVLTNQIYYALRLSTAAHAVALLQLGGVPVLQEGNVIFGSGVVARVIDTCSGLRSMEMLELAAIFFVGWFPARRLRQVLIIVLAPAIAYLFNLFRVVVMTLAPTSEFSTDHALQGLAVFFGAVVSLILVDRLLGRILPARSPAVRASGPSAVTPGARAESAAGSEETVGTPSEPNVATESDSEPRSVAVADSERADGLPASARSRGLLGAASLAVLALALLGVSIWMPRWEAPKSRGFTPVRMPAQVDGWTKTQKLEIDRGYLWTMRFRKHHYWNYERNGDEVSVFIGYDDRLNRSRSLLSRKNAVPGHGWEIEDHRLVSLESVEVPVERVVARSEFAQVLSFYWYEGTDGMAAEILRALLAIDQSPFRRPQPARVIRVSTLLGSTPLAREEGEARLRAFASALVAALRE